LFIVLKSKVLMLFLTLIMSAAAAVFIFDADMQTAEANSENSGRVLVIDPGHGGIDCGAVAADGTRESEINYSIAEKMCEIAKFAGISYTVTTNCFPMPYEQEGYSERQNLLSRVEVVNRTKNAVLISVHQNTYPDSRPSGAETLYSASCASEQFGRIIQERLVCFLDPSNRRVASPAPEKLLLTRSVDCPAVLVECGFLSNPEELQRLKSDTYQTLIAAILISAYAAFTYGEIT